MISTIIRGQLDELAEAIEKKSKAPLRDLKLRFMQFLIMQKEFNR